MLPRARVVWPTLIGGLVVLDWWADRGEPNGDTISELTRELFAVHTRAGRVRFVAAVAFGSGVLVRHICKELAPDPH